MADKDNSAFVKSMKKRPAKSNKPVELEKVELPKNGTFEITEEIEDKIAEITGATKQRRPKKEYVNKFVNVEMPETIHWLLKRENMYTGIPIKELCLRAVIEYVKKFEH